MKGNVAQMRGVRKIVYNLLKEHQKYRDSDRVLVARIWADQMGGKEALTKISAFDLMCEYVNKDSKLFNVASIIRVRRKLQEDNPELIGESFERRKNEERDVRGYLGYDSPTED